MMKTLLSVLCGLFLVFSQPALAGESSGALKFHSMVDGQFMPAVASDSDDMPLLLVQSTTAEGESAAEQAGEAAESAAEAASEAASEAAEAVAEAADAAPQTMEEKLESLRSEMQALAEQSRANAEEMVEKISSATSITEDQVYGIGVGIVVGALAADMMGLGGLATLAVSAGGGLMGNWIMSDGHGGGGDASMMEGEDLDDLAEELPETPTSEMGSSASTKGEISL